MGVGAWFQLVGKRVDVFRAVVCLTKRYAITRLAAYGRVALRDYFAQKAAGKNPILDPAILPNQRGVMAWNEDEFRAQKYE